MALIQARTAAWQGGELTDDFSDSAITVSGLTALTVGSLIAIAWGCVTVNRNVSTISGGASWDVNASRLHRINNASLGSLNLHAAITTSADTSITVTLDGSSGGAPDWVTVMEFGNAPASVTESGTSTETDDSGNSATSHSCAAVTPDTNQTVFLGMVVLNNSGSTFHKDADFTSAYDNDGLGWTGYLIQSGSTTAQGMDVTNDVARTALLIVAAVQMAGAGGLVRPKFLSLLGVGQ